MTADALFSVEGKVAVVTGASSGLGRAAATMLADRGAKVVGLARRAEALASWQAETTGKTAALVADLGDRDNWAGIAEDMCKPFGAPDILIHAAGVNTRRPTDEIDFAAWDQTLDLNLAAPFFLSQHAAPAMKAKGWGRIITFASLQSRRAFTNGLSYGASKGGIEQMTRAMAESWSADGINVNAIGPGFFPTELTGPVFADDAVREHHARQTCLGRNGKLEDLEGPLLFLCSEASAFVTGQVLFVDGGYTAK